jgi:LysR family hca operon transcriptional activator
MSQSGGMELRHFRYFIAVAKHGSFNRAAQTLHLTQPALSRQVKDLEEELAIQLFERGKNAVTLTEAGEFFYEEAQEIISRVELAVQRLRNEPRIETLRVGYAPSVTAGILPNALQRFYAEHPRVRIELADLFPQQMMRMARDGDLDIVITLDSPGTAVPNFHWEELSRIRLVLAMPADHALSKLKRIPPERLRELPLVGLAPDSFPEYVPFMKKILKPFKIRPRFVSLERDGVSTMFASIEAFNAAAILAETAAGSLPRSLVCRPFFPPFDPIIARIGWSKKNPRPHASAFIGLLRKAAQRKTTKAVTR